jgi:hypothetical protein
MPFSNLVFGYRPLRASPGRGYFPIPFCRTLIFRSHFFSTAAARTYGIAVPPAWPALRASQSQLFGAEPALTARKSMLRALALQPLAFYRMRLAPPQLYKRLPIYFSLFLSPAKHSA